MFDLSKLPLDISNPTIVKSELKSVVNPKIPTATFNTGSVAAKKRGMYVKLSTKERLLKALEDNVLVAEVLAHCTDQFSHWV